MKPTQDKRKLEEAKEIIEDLVRQFAYRGRLAYTTGGLSTLESAFSFLGWENPHSCPENKCQIKGCKEWATCGKPTKDGYKFVCGEHFRKATL